MSTKKTISVNQRHQLIDLNGDTTNFDLTFTATAQNGEEFEIVVVDQTTLDNNPQLEFRKATGTISGNIISDKNVYQNYFLCIKAEKPCNVDVFIDKKEIAPNSANVQAGQPVPAGQPTEQQMPSGNLPNMPDQAPVPELPIEQMSSVLPSAKQSVNWTKVLIGLAVLALLGFLVWKFYLQPKSGADNSADDSASVDGSAPAGSVVASEVSSQSSTYSPPTRSANKSLIDRLSKLSTY